MDSININQLNIYDKKHQFYKTNSNLSFVDEGILNQLKTAGNNKASILIIVDHQIDNLETEDNILMLKILGAVNLSIEKVFIISKPQIPLNILWRFLEVNACLVFGVEAQTMGLHINIENYQPTNFNSKIILFSDAIDDLQKHPEKKKLLWNALQAIFK